jgi:hypothetical protein
VGVAYFAPRDLPLFYAGFGGRGYGIPGIR